MEVGEGAVPEVGAVRGVGGEGGEEEGEGLFEVRGRGGVGVVDVGGSGVVRALEGRGGGEVGAVGGERRGCCCVEVVRAWRRG